MEIKELKEKFEGLKKRLSTVEKVVAVAESQKQAIEERLKTEFNITPDKLKETIETMQNDIEKTKTTLEDTLTVFEETIVNIEKKING